MMYRNDVVLKPVLLLALVWGLTVMSCDNLRKTPTIRAFEAVIKEQVAKAVVDAEKKSEDPSTWPKINKIALVENYALAEFHYHPNKMTSQMLLQRQGDRWMNVFVADTISYNQMLRLKIPEAIATKLIIQFS